MGGREWGTGGPSRGGGTIAILQCSKHGAACAAVQRADARRASVPGASPPMGAPKAAARPAAAPADTSSRWSEFLNKYSSAAALGTSPAAIAARSSSPRPARRCRFAQRYAACSAWHSMEATQAPRWIMGPGRGGVAQGPARGARWASRRHITGTGMLPLPAPAATSSCSLTLDAQRQARQAGGRRAQQLGDIHLPACSLSPPGCPQAHPDSLWLVPAGLPLCSC